MAPSMATTKAPDAESGSSAPAEWGAVFAMSLCVFTLIASEFMPVSLLSPIATTLQLTEGQAGQAIAISGVFAVVTSLGISAMAGTLDRRVLLLALTSLMIVSGVVVAFAPSYLVLMAGRALLGVVIGGFWSMSAAMIMRLVPGDMVPRGLAILNGGNAIATVIAAPLGSFVGGLIGWRGAFFCVVPVGIAALVWQAATLPPLPATTRTGTARPTMLALLKRPPVMIGMAANLLLFSGQFSLFTYLRPFLEQVTHAQLSVLSTLLLVVGVAGLIGTSLISRVLDHRLPITLGVLPAILACVALALAVFGANLIATAALLAIWGFVATAAPVAWWTWLSRTLPDDAEAGGGLIVAVIQFAITIGATLGGIAFDAVGPQLEFMGSAVLLLMAAFVSFAAGGIHRNAVAP